MTNEAIILTHAEELAREGIIQFTGNEIEVELNDDDGTVIVFEETEPIHTFAEWKRLGFQVQKGEKAIASFPIWKYVKRKKDEEADEDDTEPKGRMFMKVSHFFKQSQVMPIEQE